MEQRVSDDMLAELIAGHTPGIIKVKDWVDLDLRDARAEIKRLQELSNSQAEALNMMEKGQL